MKIKNPKEAKGKTILVELFAHGTNLCPVREYKKLSKFWGLTKNWYIPFMTREDNSTFTGRDFNKLLFPLAKNNIKPDGKHILSHSFWYVYGTGQIVTRK